MLRGEAGTGKSALLAYAAERAHDLTTVAVTGVEAESTLGFAGLHGLVRPVLAERERLPEPQRRALSAALGLEPADAVDDSSSPRVCCRCSRRSADRGPLLCLIDDAQWLDVASADALVFAARRLGVEGIVMLFAAREGESRRFDAPGLAARSIGPLDRQASLRILGATAPNAVVHVRDRLLEESAGNPLALRELRRPLRRCSSRGGVHCPRRFPSPSALRDDLRRPRSCDYRRDTQASMLLAAADDTGELRILTAAAAELGLRPMPSIRPSAASLVSTRSDTLAFAHR